MKEWIFSQAPKGAECLVLSSLAQRTGAKRISLASEVVGRDQALAAAAKAGLYLLEDELADKLLLDGLSLPKSGELVALSPSRWRATEVPCLPQGAELLGLVLERGQEAQLKMFVRKQPPTSAEAMIAIAEHLFFYDSLKVAFRYTEPRFKAN